jgi:hypothetical protein
VLLLLASKFIQVTDKCVSSDHVSDSASSQNEYLHDTERDRFGAFIKQDIVAHASPHLRMTAANLAAHELRMARAPADNCRQDSRRLLAAAKDLGFGDIAGWVVHEERKVKLSMGKRPMEKWLDNRDERLMPFRQRSSGS